MLSSIEDRISDVVTRSLPRLFFHSLWLRFCLFVFMLFLFSLLFLFCYKFWLRWTIHGCGCSNRFFFSATVISDVISVLRTVFFFYFWNYVCVCTQKTRETNDGTLLLLCLYTEDEGNKQWNIVAQEIIFFPVY